MPARPVPGWERVLRTTTFSLPYNGPADPEYFTCFDYVPSLSNLLERSVGRQPLIDVILTASLDLLQPADVNTLGILGAAIFYWGNRQPIDGNVGVIDWGSGVAPPTFGQPDPTHILLPPEASAAYQSTALPVGGVTYPIWTQQASDPIAATLNLGRTGPSGLSGYPWVQAMVQINGNLIAAGVAQLTLTQHWQPSDS